MSRAGNIFELLSDENDEGGVRPVANTEGGQKKQEQPKPKTAAPAKPQQPRGDRSDNKGVKEARPPKSNEGRANTERKQPREAGAGGEQVQGERRVNRPPRQQKEGSERRGKISERGVEGEGQPRKRVYDRKSGTGRGPKENSKRGGSGKGNWGTVEDDKKAQTENVEQPSEEKEVKEEGQDQAAAVAASTDAEAKPQEQPKEEEEVDNTKTLDEYLKSKKAPAIALPAPRKVVDSNPQWANYVQLKRDDEDERPKNAKKDEKEELKDKSGQISADQILNFTSEQPKPAFGARRGGRRDSKGPKGGKKSNTPAPNIKDEKSFPSLSGVVKV